MILVDKEIKELVAQKLLIADGFNESNINCISYDLTVENIIDSHGNNVSTYDLDPGEIIFIQSKELLYIPNNILGRIAQKNSIIRMGLYVDGPHYQPGHKTYAYLRVRNNSSEIITIDNGFKIAQIIFEELSQEPNKPYAGAFSNEMKYHGLSSYKDEYKKYIKTIEKVNENLDSRENTIYANVLTLMGIIAAVFSMITVNFQAFGAGGLDIKFIVLMNISLVFILCVFFGLLFLIINRKRKDDFPAIYSATFIILIGLFLYVYFML